MPWICEVLIETNSGPSKWMPSISFATWVEAMHEFDRHQREGRRARVVEVGKPVKPQRRQP